MDAIPVMRAIAIYSFFISLGFNAGDVYKAQGRPILLTYISIFQILILFPLMYWAVAKIGSVVVAAWMQVTVSFVVSIVYLAVALRMLNIQFYKLVSILSIPILPVLFMSAAVLGAEYLVATWNPWSKLIVEAVVGGVVYIAFLYIFARKTVNQAFEVIARVVKSKSRTLESA